MADYEYGRLHVAESVDFGGFLTVHLVFDIAAVVSGDQKHLTCTVTGNQTTYTAGGTSGFGFMNFAGLIWGEHNFRVGGLPFCNSTGTGNEVENVDRVIEQTRTASGGVVPDMVLWGVYKSDDAAQSVTREVTHFSHVFDLSSNDFDADGNLKNRQLVGYAGRWYSSGQYGTQADRAVVDTGSAFSLSLQQLHTYYYPWSVRKSGSWKSCNRSGGSYNMRSGGAWKGLKNSDNTADTQHGVWRKNNGWQRLPKFGG